MQYLLQRAHLYALSVANAVGRAAGMGAAAYTAEQRANAAAIRDYFAALPGGSPDDGYAVCGNVDGEVSLIMSLRGDKTREFPRGSAGGMMQWHQPRQQLILQHKNIDVWTQLDVMSQCAAAHAEMSESWSSYRRVLGLMQAETTLEGKVTVLVQKEEQSGSQARDVARRTALAEHWRAALPYGVTS